MNIQNLSKEKGAVIQLTANELVMICNSLYNSQSKNKSELFSQLYGDMMLARDLCLYGHIDNSCLDKILECRAKIQDIQKKE